MIRGAAILGILLLMTAPSLRADGIGPPSGASAPAFVHRALGDRSVAIAGSSTGIGSSALRPDGFGSPTTARGSPPRAVPVPPTLLTPADFCFGVWPSREGQALYPDDCYGHDEPGLSAYSSLPGSGGNVSWSFTLPTDRDATHNQSDLYGTFWFGMVLSDAHSALGEAFLELQFYPDHSWFSATTVNGNWIGLARVVQADLTTGYLDDAYVSPLLIGGTPGRYLNMHEGDSIEVNLTGWAGNPLGEGLVVRDRSSGVEADHHLYNSSGGYPLNPSYSTNSIPDALEWTNTGAPAVSFAFEVGHGQHPPFPENSSFRGCTPGPPPPTPQNPSVPCPSYDPSSWANDTASPLRLSPPVFWNATERATAAEVEILGPVGGPAGIDPMSNDSCRGREGSAYCAYPWFSYSCSDRAFEFGATNYPETSVDFGKYGAYATVPTQSAGQYSYYPQRRFALPACGGPTYSLAVAFTGAAGGSVRVLDSVFPVPGRVDGLVPGNYSLEATAPPGAAFAGWTTSAGAVVADPRSPWTSVELLGNGSVTAAFAPTVPPVRLTLNSTGCPGSIEVIAGTELRWGAEPQSVRSGSLDLAPGIYSVQALPDPGCLFVGWSSNSSATIVADRAAVFTRIVLSGETTAGALTATLVPSAQSSGLLLRLRGTPGSVAFDGTTYFSDAWVNVTVGTYAIAPTPLTGNPMPTVQAGIAVNSLDGRPGGNFTLAPGMHSLTFEFNESVAVRVNGTMPGGRFLVAAAGPIADGATAVLDQSGPTEYPLLAFPPVGTTLTGWTSTPPSALWAGPNGSLDTVLVNATGGLTAQFASAPSVALTIDVVPSASGTVALDFGSPAYNGTAGANVAPGVHFLQPVPAPGYAFSGWNTLGSATVLAGGGPGVWPLGWDRLEVGPGSPVLDAHFVPLTYPVTFVSEPSGVAATIGANAMSDGATLQLLPATYALGGVEPGGAAVGGWTTTPGLEIVGTPGSYSVVVAGPGTIFAFAYGPLDGAIEAAPSSGTVPLTVQFRAIALNGTPPYSIDWAFGDGSRATGVAPSHGFAAAGGFVVTAWINDSASATARRSTVVTVNYPVLAAQILVNASTGPAPLSVAFNGSASGGLAPYLYAWDFGDGAGTATGSNAGYEFDVPGNFTVTLTVSDFAGSSANTTRPISVGPAAPLVVVVRATPANVTVGAPLHLASLVGGGLAPYHYLWTLLPEGCSPADAAEVVCAPSGTGVFEATLEVVDRVGTSAKNSTVVRVLESGSGQGTAPVGLLGLPPPYGLTLIGAAVVLGGLGLLVLLDRSRRRPERRRPTAGTPRN